MTKVEKIESAFARLKEVEKRTGFTLDADGNEVARDKGFAVAVYEGPLYELSTHVAANGGYIGFWRDSDTGREYTELVQIVDSRDAAIALARQFEQKAIYDFANKQEDYGVW